MTTSLLAAAIFAFLLAAPVFLERYLKQLPEAPACPRCHSVARQAEQVSAVTARLPLLGRTFVAECQCGWRGRMRWRWAHESAGRPGRR